MTTFGVDQLIASKTDDLRGKRIGLVTNDSAHTAGNEIARVALKKAGYDLRRLFGPEHGLAATAPDGKAVSDSNDALTGLPVVSLYGKTHRPPPESIADLDALVFDIPDVGARFYTYLWTLSNLIEAGAEAKKPVVVLDRPNPIGGDLAMAEGPMLDEKFVSTFVGRWRMPVRYSMTVGELATMWNATRKIGCDLRVVKVEGWKREHHWPDTQLPFVPPSPNIKTYEASLCYVGTCLIEGTNLSEGRGTPTPFEWIGSPWLKADEIARDFNALKLMGIEAVPEDGTPTSRKYAGVLCHGLRLRLTQRQLVRPVAATLNLIALIARKHADVFTFQSEGSSNVGSHFDRLLGIAGVREALADPNVDAAAKIAEWTATGDWAEAAKPHLFYS